MNKQKFLQVLTGLSLGSTASFFLISSTNAHVTMCMLCAIGYSLSLLFNEFTNKCSKFISLFSGGILFYTIYAGTTLLLFEWAGMSNEDMRPEDQLIIFDPAWIYHFLINFAILVMFYTKKDKIEYVLTGIAVFMISSPVMLLIRKLFDRELWGDETKIGIYMIIGSILLLLHLLIYTFYNKNYNKFLVFMRRLIIASLVLYSVLVVLAIPINEFVK